MGNTEMSYLIYKYLEILLTDIFIDFLFNSMMSKNLFVKFQFTKSGSSLEAQWVKDLVLSLLWLGSQLWYEFDPWPGNFMMQDGKKKCVKIFLLSRMCSR